MAQSLGLELVEPVNEDDENYGIERFSNIDGEMVSDREGVFVLYEDYKQLIDDNENEFMERNLLDGIND